MVSNGGGGDGGRRGLRLLSVSTRVGTAGHFLLHVFPFVDTIGERVSSSQRDTRLAWMKLAVCLDEIEQHDKALQGRAGARV